MRWPSSERASMVSTRQLRPSDLRAGENPSAEVRPGQAMRPRPPGWRSFASKPAHQGHEPAFVEYVRTQDDRVGLVGKVAPVQQPGHVLVWIKAVLDGTTPDEVQWGRS